jgi:hypothetical protein
MQSTHAFDYVTYRTRMLLWGDEPLGYDDWAKCMVVRAELEAMRPEEMEFAESVTAFRLQALWIGEGI